jgi:hypothetical protein
MSESSISTSMEEDSAPSSASMSYSHLSTPGTTLSALPRHLQMRSNQYQFASPDSTSSSIRSPDSPFAAFGRSPLQTPQQEYRSSALNVGRAILSSSERSTAGTQQPFVPTINFDALERRDVPSRPPPSARGDHSPSGTMGPFTLPKFQPDFLQQGPIPDESGMRIHSPKYDAMDELMESSANHPMQQPIAAQTPGMNHRPLRLTGGGETRRTSLQNRSRFAQIGASSVASPITLNGRRSSAGTLNEDQYNHPIPQSPANPDFSPLQAVRRLGGGKQLVSARTTPILEPSSLSDSSRRSSSRASANFSLDLGPSDSPSLGMRNLSLR